MTVDTKSLRAARAAGTLGEWVRGRRPWAVPEGVELPDPQPWEVFSQENVLGCCEVLFGEREADAELAVVAVNAITPVCDELERLRAALAAVEYGGCPACGAEPWCNIDCLLCTRVSKALKGGVDE